MSNLKPADWDGAIVRDRRRYGDHEVVGVSESGDKLFVVEEERRRRAAWRDDVRLIPVTDVTHVAVDGSWEPL